MARKSKTRLAAGLVLTLGIADAVGIYIAKTRLGKPADIGARELAMANEPLAGPIAIRTNGELTPAVSPALAMSAVGPRTEPVSMTPRTVRVAIPEPVRAQAIAPPANQAPVRQLLARQTAPVATGALAVAERPMRRVAAERRSIAVETSPVRSYDRQVAQQRIPARATRFERTPAPVDTFSAAFAQGDDEVRLPEPAYRRGEPLPQASAELPALELSTSQIHSDPVPSPEFDVPLAPPATATSSDIVLPKS